MNAKKTWILLLIFCLVSTFTVVLTPDITYAAEKIKWSEVTKGSYNSPSPYTLNWTGNVMSNGGFDLDTMKVTADSDEADFIITQSGSIAAGGIIKVKEGLEDITDATISNFKNYESVTQGAVYLIITSDGTWAKIKIDSVVKSYMDYLSKVTFSFVLESERYDDKPQEKPQDKPQTGGNGTSNQPGAGQEPEEEYNPFASPLDDLKNATEVYTVVEEPLGVYFGVPEEYERVLVAFDIFRSDNGAPYVPVSDFILDEPEFMDNYVFAGHTYLYMLVGYDAYGDYIAFDPIKVIVVTKSAPQRTIVMTLGSTTATVDGKKVTLDAPPVIIDGRTLVPVRFISEALGAKVDWDGKTKKITITLGDTVVILTLDSSEALVNGKKVMMDVPAKSINGRTMVPVRFVGESFDQEVSFDSITKEITIIGNAAPGTGNSSNGSSSDQGTNTSTSKTNEVEKYLKQLLGKWNMWVPSLDPNVPGASSGVLTIHADNRWENNLAGKITKGEWDFNEYGQMVLYNFHYGWDWNVSASETGIRISSPPAYQVGTRAK